MAAGPSVEQSWRGPNHNIAIRRALAALVVAIGGGVLVLLVTPGIADRLGVAGDFGINLVGNALWLSLALGGALLLRQRLVLALPGWWAAALPLGAGAFALALALAAFGGHVATRQPAPLVLARYALGTAGLLLGALAEEALFRGLLQPLLARAWGAAAGVALAAAGFVLVHVAGGWRDLVTLANIGLAGVWFGLLALRSGGIAAPFLAHAGWNWAEALLFGASPNPGVDPAGSVFDVDLSGASWLGGSEDGMNSALATSLVLGLMIAALLRPGKRATP